jgi:hypothetical protein
MPITSALTDAIRQVAAEAMSPTAATIKCILFKVGAAGTYGPAYSTAYPGAGSFADEVVAGLGYTQGGATLATRTAGVLTTSYGWVDYADPVWTVAAGQTLAAIGCGFWDVTNSRWIGFMDFGGTKSVTDPGTFTVNLPGDGGSGCFRA